MSAALEHLLEAARALPLNERRELAAKLIKDVEATEAEIENNLAIVRETRGTIKGLDRETLIALAEDEEYCGY
ncbi:MAG TPA: hypothetical protein VJ464_23570 [Blastocatellia bacterium]|nr:hypothetical protein [Blastocatellia bacterium]